MTTNTQVQKHTSLNPRARRVWWAVLTLGCACVWATPALSQSPDLVPTDMRGLVRFGFGPLNSQAGGTVQITAYLVWNRGATGAAPSTTGVYLCADRVASSCTLRLASSDVPALASGGTRVISGHSVVMPPDLQPGDYYVAALADDGNAVAEADEGNNVLFAASVLHIRPLMQVDLVPSTPWDDQPAMCGGTTGPARPGDFLHPYDPCATVQVAPGGALFLFQWSVENRGSEDSPSFKVGYYLSTDPIITTADKSLGNVEVPGVPTGGLYPLALQPVRLIVPGDLPPGNYYMGILVDGLDEVPEAAGGREANNVLVRPIQIIQSVSDTLPVWRVQLHLMTGTANDAGTAQPVYAGVNSKHYWLDRPGDDFRPGGDAFYDLPLEADARFRDIDRITLGKEGSNGWCMANVELLVNNVTVYRRPSDGCTWISEGHGFSIWYDELRDSSTWQAYDPDAAGRSLLDGIPSDMFKGIVAAFVGHQIHGNGVRWESPEDQALAVTRRSEDSLNVTVRLRADVPIFGDPLLTVEFQLGFACTCGTVSVGSSTPVGTADIPWYESWFNWLVETFTPWELYSRDQVQRALSVTASTSVVTGEVSCDRYVVTEAGDVTLGAPAPDLALSLRHWPSRARPGELISVIGSATNIGTGEAGTSSELFIAPGPPPVGTKPADMIPTATQLVPPVDRGNVPACVTSPTTWTDRIPLPSDLSCRFRPHASRPGQPASANEGPSYYVIGRTISHGDINASNDVAATVVDVGLPDLALSEIRLGATTVAPGGAATLLPGYVENKGLFTSGRVQYELSLTRAAGRGEPIQLWSRTSRPLVPGERLEWGHQSLTIPASSPRGNYILNAVVRDLDGGPECGLENNARRVPLTIGP